MKARGIARSEFRTLGQNLGLFQLDTWQFGNISAPLTGLEAGIVGGHVTPMMELSDEEIETKRLERDEARKQKNFKKADEIRQFLAAHGIVIEDKSDGTSRWKR